MGIAAMLNHIIVTISALVSGGVFGWGAGYLAGHPVIGFITGCVFAVIGTGVIRGSR